MPPVLGEDVRPAAEAEALLAAAWRSALAAAEQQGARFADRDCRSAMRNTLCTTENVQKQSKHFAKRTQRLDAFLKFKYKMQ